MCYSFIANGDMLIVTLLLNLRKLFLEICKLSFVRQSFFSTKTEINNTKMVSTKISDMIIAAHIAFMCKRKQ